MKKPISLAIGLVLILGVLIFVVVSAESNLEWIHGTHGGEKCYLKGSEHGNIKYPSEPFSSYMACMESANATTTNP